ncbi:MAG: tripartite tricarboxylate transporter TctB family protein [Hyphomicrobiaceae bacterium]
MALRRDHVAGSAFVVAGALVLAVSGDLPFGTLASPGAGMLPTLVVGLMTAFGVVLLAQARRSPLIAEVDWSDLPHALRVVVVAAVAAALYVPLGFALTIPLLLLALIFLVERRPLLIALAFSLGASVAVYALFTMLLRAPLPRGLVGF